MNPDVQADFERRLKKIESTAVRYRQGVVDDTGPLDVKLGGSDVPYEDVRALPGKLAVGDTVAVLVFGNDLLVLGRIASGPTRITGTSTLTFTASTVSNTVTVTHGLGSVPVVTATPGSSTVKPAVFNKTSTTFDLLLRADSSISAAATCDWAAEI